jgi:hypothetical protein
MLLITLKAVATILILAIAVIVTAVCLYLGFTHFEIAPLIVIAWMGFLELIGYGTIFVSNILEALPV